ncbi:MAG: histidinol dehydrogenase, partial [Syntrophomonadaceae bacterium]|nr:histidinol dehydrogenase [Syntrophomonadaceae bacterium]
EYVAADLLSQAEHDPMALALLLTTSFDLAEAVSQEVKQQLSSLTRQEIIRAAIEDYGAIIVTRDLEEAVALSNRFAPEHLELMVDEPFTWLGKIENAGAIFIGPYSPEPIGDYVAGPNHILPTGGTARFYSPVTVDTFIKKSSVIAYSARGLAAVAEAAIKLASVEGLDAHANSIRVRKGDG